MGTFESFSHALPETGHLAFASRGCADICNKEREVIRDWAVTLSGGFCKHIREVVIGGFQFLGIAVQVLLIPFRQVLYTYVVEGSEQLPCQGFREGDPDSGCRAWRA